MEQKTSFGVTDYVVFGMMLAFSGGIGIYYRFTGGKQKTSREFLLADKNMSIIPVAFSLMASFMSAITLLGVSSENYVYGTQFVVINIAYIIGTPAAAFLFLPVFFQMEITSAFETLYMAIVLYAPALAMSAVTTLSKWTCIISIGIVCTFYCTLGGIKAVLWADVFQSLLMFASMFAVIIRGTMNVGGLSNVWNIAKEGGRIEFLNFDPDPTVRHTVWTLAIGGIFTYVSIYGVNQAQVQRLLTVKNVKKAQQAMFLNWPITTFLSLLTSLAGLVVYANFSRCDPLLQSKISSADQLLPYFVMTSLGFIPGLPGLFVAGIFSGALSSMSSAINSLAAVTLEDFIKPFYFKEPITERKAAITSTLLAFFYGTLCVALTYVASQLGGVLQASLTIFGVVGGPVLGLFSLGMFCRRANQWGALIGLLVSLIFCFWIGFGSHVPPTKLPVTTDGCQKNSSVILDDEYMFSSNSSLSFDNGTFTTTVPLDQNSDTFVLYKISYMWYAAIGWLVTLLVGLPVSLLTGGNKNINPSLLTPVCVNWTKKCRNKKELPLDVLTSKRGDSDEREELAGEFLCAKEIQMKEKKENIS